MPDGEVSHEHFEPEQKYLIGLWFEWPSAPILMITINIKSIWIGAAEFRVYSLCDTVRPECRAANEF